MDGIIERTLVSLKANNFRAEYAENNEAAKDKILGMIPTGAVVGIGDSATVRQIGILDELERKHIEFVNPFSKQVAVGMAAKVIDHEQRMRMLRESLACTVFLTGTNAVTEDGRLVNVDGTGNRIAGIIFGPRKAIVIIGKNKIVKDVSEALFRIRNFIAPVHAKTKKFNTPCARTGKCSDCSSKQRICNITTFIEKNPLYSNIIVVIINEDLGLGWDESWPRRRISRILDRYKQFTYITRPFWIKDYPSNIRKKS